VPRPRQNGQSGRKARTADDAKAPNGQNVGQKFARLTVPTQLFDPDLRARWGLPRKEDEPGRYIIELNLQHAEGLGGAASDFLALYETMASTKRAPRPAPVRISKTYFQCALSVQEWKNLVKLDEERAQQASESKTSRRSIYRLWPDFPVTAQTDRSMMTIKADAALRSFAAAGDGITWAVIDSGVNADHPHFRLGGGNHLLRSEDVRHLHRCFGDRYRTNENGRRIVIDALRDPDTLTGDDRQSAIRDHVNAALTDEYGHGTHVAGIIAGQAPESDLHILEREFTSTSNTTHNIAYKPRLVSGAQRPRGVAPNCKLISLRVLDDKGSGHVSSIIQALQYLHAQINHVPKLLRVHGVNLSVGYEFDAEMFACGQSPLCSEVNRLVRAGVVVVTAAGNTGYGTVASRERSTQLGLSNTINDPGNAADAITVGATHRDSPHTYGVSFFSSKGPTGDGRLKPDLVAPGERITSCGTGATLETALGTKPDQNNAYYLDDSGTSMAAPHVSGAIAAFLSIRNEFIGRPLEVKKIFLDSATPLGRERYFEGHGLVDLMRAIQSV
jgi:subtilisin family serine protease